MSAALALAVLLVVVVGVLSLAVNAQGPLPGAKPGPTSARSSESSRSSHPGSAGPRVGRRPARERPDRPERAERRAERSAPHPDAQPDGPPSGAPPMDDPSLFADVKPLNSQAKALVISVVDERTLGPVTRSRLTLRVEPAGADAFEVTTRVAFPTPEERAKVKVGATIPVRYDSEDHRRVVVDTEGGAGA